MRSAWQHGSIDLLGLINLTNCLMTIIIALKIGRNLVHVGRIHHVSDELIDSH